MGAFRIVQQQEDALPFDNGYVVYIKHEMNAGDQAIIENMMTGKDAKAGDVGLELLRLNILRITGPNSATIKVTPEMIAALEIPTKREIEAAIMERYAPFVRPGLGLTPQSITGSQENPISSQPTPPG